MSTEQTGLKPVNLPQEREEAIYDAVSEFFEQDSGIYESWTEEVMDEFPGPPGVHWLVDVVDGLRVVGEDPDGDVVVRGTAHFMSDLEDEDGTKPWATAEGEATFWVRSGEEGIEIAHYELGDLTSPQFSHPEPDDGPEEPGPEDELEAEAAEREAEGLLSEHAFSVLQRCEAIRTGHFVYTSGRHGEMYVNKDAVYMHPDEVCELCRSLASLTYSYAPQVVAAPAVGGVALSQWLAFHLSNRLKMPVLAVFCEKNPDGGMSFNRGYDKVLLNRDVIVVEDILTTGGSAASAIEAVRRCGGRVLGLAALCNRGGVRPEKVGLDPRDFMHCLVELSFDSWEEADCPLCASRVPVDTGVGKGREFLARKKTPQEKE